MHVALLVSRPDAARQMGRGAAHTGQVAPTILRLLDINPDSLQTVGQEGTLLLPRAGAGD